MCTDQQCEEHVCLHLSIDNQRSSRYLIKQQVFFFPSLSFPAHKNLSRQHLLTSAHFLTTPKDSLFHLQGQGKAVSARVNTSKSTIPMVSHSHQVSFGEKELGRGAYSNLQQARRPGPG